MSGRRETNVQINIPINVAYRNNKIILGDV